MRYYVAPMEGLTGWVFRQVHSRRFPGADRYYTPFVSPGQERSFTKRDLSELSPEHNEGVPVVPQLLTRRSEDFIRAAAELADMGYREVNLNLGCPSGTVAAKGKGAGFLGRPEELNRFLEEIFSRVTVAVSVKTRLGVEDPEEFPRLMEIYSRYPIAELILHPRVRRDFYKNRARREWFAWTLDHSPFPLCCNGDLVGVEACRRLESDFPGASAMMAGRGLMADPSLFTRLRGGPELTRAALRDFLEELCDSYSRAFDSRQNAMLRMKELWFYLIGLFEDDGTWARAIRKARGMEEYQAQVEAVFQRLPLRREAAPVWQ